MAKRTPLDSRMAALAEGDRSAFDDVYRALFPVVHRYCSRSLGPGESDDATQEVLIKLFQQATDYRPNEPVLAWALAVARWECRTRLTKRGRNKETASRFERAQMVDPDARLMQQAAAEALADLCEQDREVILSALNEEHPPGATFRKRKQRALGRLRAVWRKRHG